MVYGVFKSRFRGGWTRICARAVDWALSRARLSLSLSLSLDVRRRHDAIDVGKLRKREVRDDAERWIPHVTRESSERRSSEEVVREESPACSWTPDGFRGNVVVDDAAPYAEDHWSTVRIADVVDAELCKPCSRCSIPAVDPDTGDSSGGAPRRRALASAGRRPGHRQPSLARQLPFFGMESRVSHRSTRSLTRAQSRRRRRRARDPRRAPWTRRVPKVTTSSPVMAAFLESRLVTTPFFRGQVFPRPRLSIVVIRRRLARRRADRDDRARAILRIASSSFRRASRARRARASRASRRAERIVVPAAGPDAVGAMAKLLVTSPDGLSAELDERIDTVVLDCDGVVWHGDPLIPGAKAAVEALTGARERASSSRRIIQPSLGITTRRNSRLSGCRCRDIRYTRLRTRRRVI